MIDLGIILKENVKKVIQEIRSNGATYHLTFKDHGEVSVFNRNGRLGGKIITKGSVISTDFFNQVTGNDLLTLSLYNPECYGGELTKINYN